MTQNRFTAATPGTGTVLGGRYLLTGRVGRGGMADVFAAQDQVLHRSVAVKVFRFDTPAAEDQARVDAEIHTLARLRHPGLVTVFDAGSVTEYSGGVTPYVVMELVTGPSLAQRLSQGPLTAAQAALLGADVAATLAYVHGQGVVHRDVKPANILLDAATGDRAPFMAKLSDFGIARLLDSARLTMIGTTVGTANYLSPEQATGAATGPPSDVYSLGLVLLECLTGRLAYPGTGVQAAMARLHRQPVVPDSLGPAWSRLLTAMTSPDPAQRPTAVEASRALSALAAAPDSDAAAATTPAAATALPDATTLLDATTNSGDTAVLRPDEPPAGTVGARRRRPRSRMWIALAALAAAILAAVILALNSSQQLPPTAGAGTSSPAPTYPTVPGTLGQHLRQLEGAVG